MRQETNNEIDLLLRRLSRREEGLTPDADLRIDSDHLDADDLSSYAENVVPAAARARYTEHLAECARCRELVVQLSASVPLVARKETLTAAGPSGLSKFLASLFSPMVLRYAVPALGLIVVAAIGLLVLRSRDSSPFVAQLEPNTQPVPAAAPTENPQSGFIDGDSQRRKDSQSPAAKPEIPARRGNEAEDHPPPNAPPTVSSVRVEPKTDAAVQKAEEQPQPTPTPAPKPAETVDEIRVEVEARKPQAAPGNVAPAGGFAREKNIEGLRDAETKSATVTAGRSAGKVKKTESAAQTAGDTSDFHIAQQDKDRADGVIRTVGGRRFRKQGGLWVDTAYNSNSAIVNVARGSEQYRALIADEPTIKTIAEQLDGPIIVVWKGRTYRIR
jgi:hypothetical protein